MILFFFLFLVLSQTFLQQFLLLVLYAFLFTVDKCSHSATSDTLGAVKLEMGMAGFNS